MLDARSRSTMQPRIERISFAPIERGIDPPWFAECCKIRRIVFVEEQSVPAELEWDGLDEIAEHFIALTHPGPDERARGTARMRVIGSTAQAERVAVLESARHLGLGRLLMEAIESRARNRALSRICLNAQVAAVPFYERLGYRSEGDEFIEAGIKHRAMSKDLD